ncbi:hypothetical protein CLOSCI_01857, partial [[Clostridium] scindens ATCC 35704]
LMKHYKRYSKELKLQAVQEYFIDVNDKRVLRICRKKDIKSTIKYSNNGCTGQAANPQYIAENILNREFTVICQMRNGLLTSRNLNIMSDP